MDCGLRYVEVSCHVRRVDAAVAGPAAGAGPEHAEQLGRKLPVEKGNASAAAPSSSKHILPSIAARAAPHLLCSLTQAMENSMTKAAKARKEANAMEVARVDWHSDPEGSSEDDSAEEHE